MVGLIWFVQIVHYPLFSQVGREYFRQYEIDHQRLTSLVVVPLMLLELATAIALIWFRPDQLTNTSVWLGLLLVALIWVITFSIQVPQHAALSLSYDQSLQKRLVAGNWYRTVAWTMRGMLVLWMVGCLISASHGQEIAERL